VLAIQRFTAIGAIDAAFWLYRRHFGLLFAISLIVGVPASCVGAAQAYWKSHADPALPLQLALTLPNMAVAILASSFGSAATTHAASRIALGQHASIGGALAAARKVFARMLGAAMLAGSAIAICALLTGALVVGVSVGVLSLRTGRRFLEMALVCLGLGIPALILLVRWSLVAPTIVLEGATSARALGRSVELTEGRRWKILAVLALYLLASLSIAGGLGAGIELLGEGVRDNQLLQTVLGQAISALLSPVLYSALVLLYYDARVELEAFDIAVLAHWQTSGAA
jgi:hypothetical protein